MKKVAASVVILLGLTACGESSEGDDKQAGSQAAPTETPAGPSPGLWRFTTSLEGLPAGSNPPPSEVCMTQMTFEMPTAPATTPGMNCTSTEFARNGDALENTTTCSMDGGLKAVVLTSVTGDFSKEYTMVSTTKLTGGPTAMPDTKLNVKAERLGDCPK